MLNPKVIFENKDFLVIDKPAGLLMHGVVVGKRNQGEEKEKTLADWLLENYPEVGQVGDDPVNRPGIVHRLDKETSGIVLVPRNQKTFEYLKKLFQKGEVRKTYLALVCGKMKNSEGVISKPIGIKSGTTKRSVHSLKMSKEAITEYKVIKFLKLGDKDFTLVEVRPKTGRTHQIRVHLAYLGYPVVGDKLYGGKKTQFEGLERQFLHAKAIEFVAPTGERLKFETELPEELESLLGN